jgi:hypothetical protein
MYHTLNRVPDRYLTFHSNNKMTDFDPVLN